MVARIKRKVESRGKSQTGSRTRREILQNRLNFTRHSRHTLFKLFHDFHSSLRRGFFRCFFSDSDSLDSPHSNSKPRSERKMLEKLSLWFENDRTTWAAAAHTVTVAFSPISLRLLLEIFSHSSALCFCAFLIRWSCLKLSWTSHCRCKSSFKVHFPSNIQREMVCLRVSHSESTKIQSSSRRGRGSGEGKVEEAWFFLWIFTLRCRRGFDIRSRDEVSPGLIQE